MSETFKLPDHDELPQLVQTTLFDVGARVRKAVQTGYKFDQQLFPSYHKDQTDRNELPQQKHDPNLRLDDLKQELAADSIFWDTASTQEIADSFAKPDFLKSH
ncbi:hypothetical protein POMI540_2462 [Schizosaccharomyces pombe]|uniref:S-phase delaying protein 2 n=1 Tax=Schizosaccharomyces pombe (strain 972 / ATCC 24843) TaxID=284812 RepID=SPD2_SCHPO|nr:ribonucleotide reductase (RNR) inhibitor family [Schizosaccharomyces pombe]G2TRL7.1 RecName: Full=S-phase delaying protein 2 [Schizosaccharomyces pombe 972h-]CCD31322.1 ribonucleotide reductase (RNR) inhibitor family [Schizosaccharomyces pombe]|eukprot:NP_001343112.1 ribonucleotide reductase (RNR) inhibitor family [Schizosaccharomyces pombe]